MRADVNLSVRVAGSDTLGTRTEMKNLNSFKAIAHAIEGERERQIELLEMGKSVTQETRRWDDNKESSHAMRSKEDAKDYRYFPDPDLPPIHISDAVSCQSSGRRRLPVIRVSLVFRSMIPRFLQSPDIWLLCLRRLPVFAAIRRRRQTGLWWKCFVL